MINARVFLVILSLVLVRPAGAIATARVPGLDIKVAFDQSAYELKVTDAAFTYAEGPVRLAAKLRPCNRAAYHALARAFRTRRTIPNPRRSLEYDVRLDDAGAARSIPRGDPLGTWLRQIPARITYVYVGAEVACHR